MKLDVYDTANSTHLGTLAEAYNISFLDDLTMAGSASFQVDVASTADLALLEPRRVVRFRTGASAGTGDVFACIVQDRPAELLADIEPESGETITVVTFQCPALLSWLGNTLGGAVLYPYGGMGGRQQNPRMFGWFTPDFDDSGWTDVTGSDRVKGPLSTAGWPDDNAVAYQTILPGDRALYRRTMPSDSSLAGLARMFIAASWLTQVTVYLDGDVVLEKPPGQSGLFFADVDYEPLDHEVAIEVKGGAGRWGFTWVRLVETEDDDGNEVLELGSPIRTTFDPDDYPSAELWKVYEGGDDDWLAAAFDDSEWAGPISDGGISTDGWPDANAVGYAAQADRMRYRRTMVPAAGLGATQTMSVVASWRTSVRVFLDEVEVLTKPAGETGVFSEDVAYPGTEQQLAVLVNGGGRWGWTWEDDDGTTIRRTYDPATVSTSEEWTAEPDPVPGVTVGEVMKTAIDEAQTRGLLPDLTYDFDGDDDSNEEAWEIEFTRGFRMQELGRLLDELVSIEGEPEMTPAGLLKFHAKRGTDRTATVTIAQPFSLGLTGRGPQATRWLFETDGGLGQIVNQDAEAELGVVMEQFVQLGNDVEPDAISPSLVRQLVRDGGSNDDAEVHLPDDVVPYDDVFLGDEVTADARDGSTRTVRLTQFEYQQTDAGEDVWMATMSADA